MKICLKIYQSLYLVWFPRFLTNKYDFKFFPNPHIYIVFFSSAFQAPSWIWERYFTYILKLLDSRFLIRDELYRLNNRLTFSCSCAGDLAMRNNMKFSLPLMACEICFKRTVDRKNVIKRNTSKSNEKKRRIVKNFMKKPLSTANS